MKIKITEESKKILTLAKMDAVKKMQKYMEDEDNLKWEAESAAALACGQSMPIIKIESEVALNCRIKDFYGEGSEDVDVWMTIWAFDPYYGFYTIGAYLSDIWQIGPEDRKDEIRSHMYIRSYKEQK